jgi:two-component system NtrC family sensor kinase
LRLGTKLTLYLSLIIIVVLSGYGYFQILSRRDILMRKMKVEVKSVGQTLRVSLEEISLQREMEHVQDLIDAVEEHEKTLGVIVYHQGKDLLFRSHSLGNEIEPHLELIKRAIREDRPQEQFGSYKEIPVFSYTFPLKDRRGRNIGGVAILQHTFSVEDDIKKAKWSIFISIFMLIGGTVALVLFGTRRWVTQPIGKLIDGINRLAKGDLDHQVDLERGDELSELARAFNRMSLDLRKARERILEEGEKKLELERSLRQSEKLATIGQLASGLAHEIGTPLNIIGGRAELTKRKLDDRDTAQRNLDIIAQQAERITKIIQQLLGFVRKKKPEQIALDISHLLETTLEFLDQQIQRQRVRVVKEGAGDLPPVRGDPDQLQQVFLNLILNAIQAMPNGGTLRLSISSQWISKEEIGDGQRQYVEVRVEDTGGGMKKEIVESIFSPFFSMKEKGTGLGLTVSQGIVQDHEGWINVESEPGKGSVFKIYLPASPQEG